MNQTALQLIQLKLYSQMAQLYEWIKDSNGPITQGMRDVYGEQKKELEQALANWRTAVGELAGLNQQARAAELPEIIGPEKK